MPEPLARVQLPELLVVDMVSSGAVLTLHCQGEASRGHLWFQVGTSHLPTAVLSAQMVKEIQTSIKAAVLSTLREHGYMQEVIPDKSDTDEQAEIS